MSELHFSLPSFQSLLLRLSVAGTPLGTGTGFVVDSPNGSVLITNRHIVTGRHQDTDQPLSPTGGIPDELTIVHNGIGRLGDWHDRVETLYDANGNPLWKEHPQLGSQADMAALPLTALEGVALHPHLLDSPVPNMAINVADRVSVVGFPFGLQGGGSLAIWATGFIASEPDIDFEGLPQFLVDCRTRPGQSGSAVIIHQNGGMYNTTDGSHLMDARTITVLLGVYSGRINNESDLGRVWKAGAIRKLVESI